MARISQHVFGTRRGDQRFEPCGLRSGRRSATAREPIVATPFIIDRGIGALTALLDEALLEQTLYCAVQGRGSQFDGAFTSDIDVPHDCVTVPFFIKKRKKDGKSRIAERHLLTIS